MSRTRKKIILRDVTQTQKKQKKSKLKDNQAKINNP